MRYYYEEKDILNICEHVLGRKLNEKETNLFENKIKYYENPRYGYHIYSTIKGLLRALNRENYYITNFIGGHGLCSRKNGGCYGYIDESLYRLMVKDEIITESGSILENGYAILAQ